MVNLFIFFIRQPESKAVFVLFVSTVITSLSAFSVLYIPNSIWQFISSSYVFISLHILGIYVVTRWFARGEQYSALKTKNLSGKTYLITGSAGGIGKQTALQLAKRGAKIVLFARSTNLQRTIDDVKKVARDETLVSGYPIDLSDLLSIKKGIEQYKTNEGENAPITGLINNAGVMACPYSLTKDGLERQMGTNHFGHFYLTELLLPQLLKSLSRVINVSSTAHALWQVPCTIETYNQQLNKDSYTPWHAYAISKIANIYFTIELQRRFGEQGLRAYSLHPGAVATGLQRHLPMSQLFDVPLRFLLFKTELEGAQTNLFCAVSDDARPGKYHSDCRESELANPHADNPELAQQWWDYSEKIINEKIKQHHD